MSVCRIRNPALVNRDGIVCAVTYTVATRFDQWHLAWRCQPRIYGLQHSRVVVFFDSSSATHLQTGYHLWKGLWQQISQSAILGPFCLTTVNAWMMLEASNPIQSHNNQEWS